MGKKKRDTYPINVPLDLELADELKTYLSEQRKADPFLTQSDVVRKFIREGLKGSRAIAK